MAVLIVHHLRKLSADDPLDQISGSMGLTGGVGDALVLACILSARVGSSLQESAVAKRVAMKPSDTLSTLRRLRGSEAYWSKYRNFGT